MKIFPFVSEEEHATLQVTLAERNRDLVNQSNELGAMRASLRGSEIDHAKEVLRFREQISLAERTSATAVAMTAEKQKEIASLRGQINEILAAHKEQINRLEDRAEKLMDWIAKGYSGVPIFEKPQVPNLELPSPAAASTTASEAMTEPVETDMQEALRTAGPKARNIIRHLTARSDANFNDEQRQVRETFKEDKAIGEAAAVVPQTT